MTFKIICASGWSPVDLHNRLNNRIIEIKNVKSVSRPSFSGATVCVTVEFLEHVIEFYE